MRRAVEQAYRELTGEEPRFIFSGWGYELDEIERELVEASPRRKITRWKRRTG
jgi:hypothetical protein